MWQRRLVFVLLLGVLGLLPAQARPAERAELWDGPFCRTEQAAIQLAEAYQNGGEETLTDMTDELQSVNACTLGKHPYRLFVVQLGLKVHWISGTAEVLGLGRKEGGRPIVFVVDIRPSFKAYQI